MSGARCDCLCACAQIAKVTGAKINYNVYWPHKTNLMGTIAPTAPFYTGVSYYDTGRDSLSHCPASMLLVARLLANSSLDQSKPIVANLLEQNCWNELPDWECYAANIAGLVSTALWFIVLVPQVLKNWWRRSVVGLSFLWAVANFTASLVGLFFTFSVQMPLYVKISAVYMPILEFTILCQFMVYSLKPFTTRLLCLLACLIVWGTIIELELIFPDSRDKVQWVAIALWSIETFPQVSELHLTLFRTHF